jgi:hypothetical protein
MANNQEISTALAILAGARLRNSPPNDPETIKGIFTTWTNTLADIPGEYLIQASKDLVISSDFWPTIKAIRSQAYQVKAHNGMSSTSDRFSPPIADIKWTTSGADTIVFPDAIARRIQALEDKLERGYELSDAELREMDKLVRPIIEEALPIARMERSYVLDPI